MTPEEFKVRMEYLETEGEKTLYGEAAKQVRIKLGWKPQISLQPPADAEKIDDPLDVDSVGPYERHEKMDALMCELLANLGYGEGVEVFKRTYKWYG